MNWKEKIADWLTGGAVSASYNHAKDMQDAASAQRKSAEYHCRKHGEAIVALRDIAAMKTPNANATVKRMAARAEEVLG